MNSTLLIAGLMLGQSIEMPATQRGGVGEIVTVRPKLVAGGKVVFFPLDAGLSIFPAEKLVDPTELVFVASTPGKYRILAYTAKGDQPSQPSICTVEITLAKPIAPDDDIAKDSLYSALAGILGGLQEPDQKANLAKIAGMYSEAAKIAPKAKTLGEWNIALRGLSNAAGLGQSLLTVRQRVASELAETLGTNPAAAMDGELGARCAAQANRTARVLNQLAK